MCFDVNRFSILAVRVSLLVFNGTGMFLAADPKMCRTA
jgi:hypothetical protein